MRRDAVDDKGCARRTFDAVQARERDVLGAIEAE